MYKRIAIVFLIIGAIIGVSEYVRESYKCTKIEIVTSKDKVVIRHFFVPSDSDFHLYKCRLQYTKCNGWYETVFYNVKSFKEIK